MSLWAGYRLAIGLPPNCPGAAVRRAHQPARRRGGDAACSSDRRTHIRTVQKIGVIVDHVVDRTNIVGFQGMNQESARLVGHGGW